MISLGSSDHYVSLACWDIPNPGKCYPRSSRSLYVGELGVMEDAVLDILLCNALIQNYHEVVAIYIIHT